MLSSQFFKLFKHVSPLNGLVRESTRNFGITRDIYQKLGGEIRNVPSSYLESHLFQKICCNDKIMCKNIHTTLPSFSKGNAQRSEQFKSGMMVIAVGLIFVVLIYTERKMKQGFDIVIVGEK